MHLQDQFVNRDFVTIDPSDILMIGRSALIGNFLMIGRSAPIGILFFVNWEAELVGTFFDKLDISTFVSRVSFLVSRFLFLVSRISFLVSRFSFSEISNRVAQGKKIMSIRFSDFVI